MTRSRSALDRRRLRQPRPPGRVGRPAAPHLAARLPGQRHATRAWTSVAGVSGGTCGPRTGPTRHAASRLPRGARRGRSHVERAGRVPRHMLMKRLVALACLPLALGACGTVSPEDVELSSPPPGPCATAQAERLADGIGAVASDSPLAAAEQFARIGRGGRLPRTDWVAYERQGDSVLLAAGRWRVRAAQVEAEDSGWLVVESYRCE